MFCFYLRLTIFFPSVDIYVIDERLAMTFGSFFRVVASVLGVVFVIGTSAPMFLAVAIP